jgi:hypothetical protein
MRLLFLLAGCALVSLATGCIAVPGSQEPCPYSLVAAWTLSPDLATRIAGEDSCD